MNNEQRSQYGVLKKRIIKTAETFSIKILFENFIFVYLLIYHLYVNCLSNLTNKILVLKKTLFSLIFFFGKKIISNSLNFLFISKKNLIKKKYFKRLDLSEGKILSEKEKYKILQSQQNQDSFMMFQKKKINLLKKYRKFYKKYLTITFHGTNNLFICKFLDLGFFFILILKNHKKFYINYIKLNKTKKIRFFRKEFKKLNSISRAFLLCKKNANFIFQDP